MTVRTIEALADELRVALSSEDVGSFADLLDPNVTWGAPGDPSPSCQNRRHVLAWYQRGQAAGRRALVRSVTVHGNKILVATTVSSTVDETQEERWQVLVVAGGRITDIRGYDNEAEAHDAMQADH